MQYEGDNLATTRNVLNKYLVVEDEEEGVLARLALRVCQLAWRDRTEFRMPLASWRRPSGLLQPPRKQVKTDEEVS